MTGLLALVFSSVLFVTEPCTTEKVGKVIMTTDKAAPLVLRIASGAKFRLYGQDFVNPRLWRAGENLSICRTGKLPGDVEVTNLTRHEALAAIEVTSRISPKGPIQVLAGPSFESLLKETRVLCPNSRVRWATPGVFLEFEEELLAKKTSEERRRVDSMPGRSCENRDGASCPTGRILDQLERAGMMHKVAEAVCARGTGEWQ